MHTFLITGGTKDARDAWIQNELNTRHISPFDTRIVDIQEETLSIGIQEIKAFEKQLILAPIHSPISSGIIKNAHLLTIDAEHALLKTLEEPPKHAIIILETQSPNVLLPTILSRATNIQLKTPTTPKNNTYETIQKTLLLFMNPTILLGEKMIVVDSVITNNKTAKQWIEDALIVLHENRKTYESQAFLYMGKRLLKAQDMLRVNVSYKLAIDHIFLP